MSYFKELEERSPSGLMEVFDSDALPPDVSEEERPLWFEEVAILLAEGGEAGVDFLTQRIEGADTAKLAAILSALTFGKEHLSEDKRAKARDLLLSFLGHPDELVVARAVDSLGHLDDQEETERVWPLLRHPSPYVVASVHRFLRQHAPEKAWPILLDGLKSPDPIVRQSALDELDELGRPEALAAIRPLLDDEDADVRQAAETAVEHLEQYLAEAP